jgi:hypothetical protein
MRAKLPPRRYWRARTPDDRLRSRRAGLLPGLLGGLLIFAILVPVVLLTGGEPPTWLVWAVALPRDPGRRCVGRAAAGASEAGRGQRPWRAVAQSCIPDTVCRPVTSRVDATRYIDQHPCGWLLM